MSKYANLPTLPSQTPVVARSLNVEKELTIADLWSLLLRRRTTMLVILLFFVVAGALVCVFSTRRYEATAELQVQKEVASPLGLRGEDTNSSYSDALEDNMTLQTQANILESDSLALSVIEKLNLEANSDFRPRFSVLGWLVGLVTPAGPRDPEHGTLEDSPRRRMEALKVFKSRLKVKPMAGTRIIEVSYLNPDPVVAAAVTNSLSQGLIEYNFQIRHAATSKIAQWLGGQLGDLRQQSEQLQDKVAQAQRDSGVLSLGGVDSQGREQLYSSELDKLQQATAAYSQAESNRILKQAIYEVARTGDPEAISGLAENPMFAGTNGMANSLNLIQSLRMQQAETQAQIAALSAKFGPAYPKLTEAQSQLSATQGAIRDEVKRITDRAQNDFDVAREVENTTHNIYLDQKRQAGSLNDKAMAYTILRQESDESRALYEGLFRQMKEAGVLADFHSNSIAVVDPARVPAKPARPMIPLYMLASVGGGLLFGFCGALLRDGTDRRIQNVAEVEARLGQPAFALIPYHKTSVVRGRNSAIVEALPNNGQMLLDGLVPASKHSFPKTSARAANDLPALGDSRSCYVESLRALRTSLLLSRGGAPPKVILVTSSVASEGKSMLSLNLAALFALQHKNVLLIDADLRRPMLHRRLGLPGEGGLSSLLAGQKTYDDPSVIVRSEKLSGLHVLPAGPVPPYPAELLGSEQMRKGLDSWRDQFDFIILDGPPVLPVTDSVILSTMADFTLLVARYDVTEQQALERSHRTLLAQTGANQVGVVLNGIRESENTYCQYNNSAYNGVQEKVHETV